MAAESPLIGWLAVIIACLAFGSFAVPMKAEAVVKVHVHPLVFQSYKTFWVFITSFLTAFWYPVEFTPWGIVSGLSWVPAGVAAVVSVQHIGLGVGQGTWSSIIVLVSFLWGVLYFEEKLQSYPLSIFGVFCLMCGVGGMAYFSAQAAADVEDGETQAKYIELQLGDRPIGDIRNGNVGLDVTFKDKKLHGHAAKIGCSLYKYFTRRQIGLLAAIFNGVWGGSNMVPLRIVQGSTDPADKKTSSSASVIPSGIGYVISFAIGSAIVNVVMWLCLYLWKKNISAETMPSFHVKVMFLPGMIAGCLWSLGNVMAMVAVLSLGEAVGYSCVQASILVSGLWSIFYYHEIKDTRHILLWLGSAFCALVGIILLSIMQQT